MTSAYLDHLPRAENSKYACYFICTLPRSGSWLLCDLLESTQAAGYPDELFEETRLRRAAGIPIANYIANALEFGSTSNGVFGTKIHWAQFEVACRELREARRDPESADTQILKTYFPGLRFIWLTRRDKARQAISYYRAIHTDRWWYDGQQAATPQITDPLFDFDGIERLEHYLRDCEAKWQAFFENCGLEPFVVVYEELVADARDVVAAILDYLGVGLAALPELQTMLQCQSDALSDEWVERYLRLKAAHFDDAVPARLAARPEIEEIPASVAVPPVMSSKEFRIAAIQRSGHHGIINWIAGQSTDSVLLLNDAEPETNPFFTASIVSRLDLPGRPRIPRMHVEPFVPRGTILYNYEDRPLESVFSPKFESSHDGWLGPSAERVDVVVLRDVFNTFASRMSLNWMRHRLDQPQELLQLVALWKSYARELAGETSVAIHRPVAISYNRWVADVDYRRLIAHALGLEFSDAGMRTVSAEYGGSSFDGVCFDGRAEKMNVLERWKTYVQDPLFSSIFKDDELVELSDTVFGPIPGTDCLRAPVFSMAFSGRGQR